MNRACIRVLGGETEQQRLRWCTQVEKLCSTQSEARQLARRSGPGNYLTPGALDAASLLATGAGE